MTLRLNLVHLAWDQVTGSTNYEIQLDGVKVAIAGPKAKTTKITIPEGAEHKVTIRALPSGSLQDAKFQWASATDPPPDPPAEYTYRWATFNPATDIITGCINRSNEHDNDNWWVPGTPLTGDPWEDNGGLWEITHPTYGPGFELRCTKSMVYPVPLDTRIIRFMEESPPWFVRGATLQWDWTWMWPSADNPGGWSSQWMTGEGLTIANYVNGIATVGHHLFFDKSVFSTLGYRFGRCTSNQQWVFTFCPFEFPADTYHHMRVVMKVTDASNGFIHVFTDRGSGFEQWVNYSGPTFPLNFSMPYGHMMNIRIPLWDYDPAHPQHGFFPYNNVLHWLNHRVTVTLDA